MMRLQKVFTLVELLMAIHTIIQSLKTVYMKILKKNELLLFKGNEVKGNIGADRNRLGGANIVFDTYPISTTNRTDENIRMTILSNSNVGIGTTTPTALVDVNGNIQCNTLTAENIIVGSTNLITEINTKQSIIHDNDLTIPKVLNLKSSLDEKKVIHYYFNGCNL